ncbi:MAG: nucleotide exchange factor GrpE, partial [Myxococcales bacterium]|nr:nucleotide exchange factor GrpE [Myxococcales bacterium]
MPDDTHVPPEAAAVEERAVPEEQPGAAPPTEPVDVEKLQAKVRLLEAQLEESFKRSRETNDRLKDTHERLLRTAAEFDNFKKRSGKEKEDAA